MIANILGVTWLVGWLLAIHPVYKAMLRSFIDYDLKHGHRQGIAPVIWSLVLATIAGLVWPLAIPFALSRLVYARAPIVNARAEIDRTKEDLAADAELRRRMREARKEIEVTAREAEDEVDRRNPIPGRPW